MTTYELIFVNSDARPKVTVLSVGLASVRPIMAWYGAYYSGDRYTVSLDGYRLDKDHNGELVGGASATAISSQPIQEG